MISTRRSLQGKEKNSGPLRARYPYHHQFRKPCKRMNKKILLLSIFPRVGKTEVKYPKTLSSHNFVQSTSFLFFSFVCVWLSSLFNDIAAVEAALKTSGQSSSVHIAYFQKGIKSYNSNSQLADARTNKKGKGKKLKRCSKFKRAVSLHHFITFRSTPSISGPAQRFFFSPSTVVKET